MKKDEHHFLGGDISIVVLIHGKQQSDANGLGHVPEYHIMPVLP